MARPEAEIAWAAGLFEGEGCIYIRPNGSFLALHIQMTDRDVVEHFADVVDVGAIYEHPSRRDQRTGWKDAWTWNAQAGNAVTVIGLLLPYFGKRRTAKAHEATALYLGFVERVTAARICVRCGDSYRPTLRSHGRQQYCTILCRKQGTEERRLALAGRA